jgi:hypothetical protein
MNKPSPYEPQPSYRPKFKRDNSRKPGPGSAYVPAISYRPTYKPTKAPVLKEKTMILVVCSVCNQELNEPGALIFSPPDKDGKTKKDHVCVGCYKIIKEQFRDKFK